MEVEDYRVLSISFISLAICFYSTYRVLKFSLKEQYKIVLIILGDLLAILGASQYYVHFWITDYVDYNGSYYCRMDSIFLKIL